MLQGLNVVRHTEWEAAGQAAPEGMYGAHTQICTFVRQRRGQCGVGT